MLVWNGRNLNGTVLENNFVDSGIDRAENHMKGELFAEVLQLRFHEFLQVRMRVDVYVGGVVEHSEGRNETHQPEAMIAVEVRDENMADMAIFEVHLPHPYLSTLATINEKLLIPEFQQL